MPVSRSQLVPAAGELLAPVEPAPPQDLGSQDLVCLGCERAPKIDHIQWSNVQGRPIHTAVRAKLPGNLDRICGGFVVRREQAWEGSLAPGVIALCIPSRLRSTAHYVRLGRTNGKRNQSWTGTPLCGANPKIRHWLPIEEGLETQFRPCAKCRKALAQHPV